MTDLALLCWLHSIHDPEADAPRMLRAVASATLPYDGQQVVITAGITHVSPDHELARRFPSLFEAPPQALEAEQSKASEPDCWEEGRPRVVRVLGSSHGARHRRWSWSTD